MNLWVATRGKKGFSNLYFAIPFKGKVRQRAGFFLYLLRERMIFVEMMQEKMLLVLSASRYDFKAEDGRRLDGTKFTFVDPTGQKAEENVVGYVIKEERLDYDRFNDFAKGPGFYRTVLGIDLTGKKPKVMYERFEYCGALNAVDLLAKIPGSKSPAQVSNA